MTQQQDQIWQQEEREVPHFTTLMVTHAGDKSEFLRQALQSLAEQTLAAEKTVLVCAGPLPLALNEIIAHYQPILRIQRIDLSKNRPLGFSLNMGLAAVDTEWVARMDSDDICLTDRFEKQFKFLATNPEFSVLGSAIAEFETDPKHPIRTRTVPTNHDEVAKQAFLRTPFNHMSVVYKKSDVLAVGGYRMLLGYEDFDLWTRMLVNGATMANLETPLILARIGNGFHQRRGGWAYAKAEWRALAVANRINSINPWKVRLSMVPRFLMRLLPTSLREVFYKLVRQ